MCSRWFSFGISCSLSIIYGHVSDHGQNVMFGWCVCILSRFNDDGSTCCARGIGSGHWYLRLVFSRLEIFAIIFSTFGRLLILFSSST